MSVLLVLAHPGTPPSRVNAALAAAARGVPGVTPHDLYDAYPHFFVDARREQARVDTHAAIVFQPSDSNSAFASAQCWANVYGPSGLSDLSWPLKSCRITRKPNFSNMGYSSAFQGVDLEILAADTSRGNKLGENAACQTAGEKTTRIRISTHPSNQIVIICEI